MKKIFTIIALVLVSLFIFACASPKKSDVVVNKGDSKVNTIVENNAKEEIVKKVEKHRNPDIVSAENDVKNGKYTQAMERIEYLKDKSMEAKTVYYYAWIKRDEPKWQKEVLDYEPMVKVLSDSYDGDLKEDIKKYKKEYYNKKNKEFIVPENPAIKDIKERCALVVSKDLLNVDVIEGFEENTYGVVVKVRAIDSALTDSILKQKNLERCADIFYMLYTSNYNFMYVTVIGYVNAIDSYGNNRSSVLMKCTLRQDTAKRINWGNLSSVKWEYVLDEYRVSRELR